MFSLKLLLFDITGLPRTLYSLPWILGKRWNLGNFVFFIMKLFIVSPLRLPHFIILAQAIFIAFKRGAGSFGTFSYTFSFTNCCSILSHTTTAEPLSAHFVTILSSFLGSYNSLCFFLKGLLNLPLGIIFYITFSSKLVKFNTMVVY